MSVRIMTLVWAQDLPDSDKIVLLALADCANDEGHCWPSVRSLVAKCSKTDRTIQASIKRLVDAGHLTRREVPGKGCNYSVHPRNACAPESVSPPKGTAQTPEAASDKPSRTINSEAKASSERVVDYFNQTAKAAGWSSAQVIDASRRQTIRLRLKSHGEDNLKLAVDRLKAAAWVREKVRAGTWKPDLDYFLRPATLRKLLEGTFTEEPVKESKTPAQMLASLEERVAFWRKIGRDDEAAEAQTQADRIRASLNDDEGRVRSLGSLAQKIVERAANA